VEAGAITELTMPIAGISKVSNFDPTFLGSEEESDEALRSRARAALRSIGKGTAASLAQAVFEERATLSEIWDGAPDKTVSQGSVTLLVECEPGQLPRLRARVEETRAAGVYATLIARYIYIKPRIHVKISSGLPDDGKEKLRNEIISALRYYVGSLGSGKPAEGSKMIEAVEKVNGVKERGVRILEVMAWRQDLDQSNEKSTVDKILYSIKKASGDDQAIREAITEAISGEALSTTSAGQRVLDRSLVKGSSDDQATDEQIEKGSFSVIAKKNGKDYWIVLDMEKADLRLLES